MSSSGDYCYKCGKFVLEKDAVGFKLAVDKPKELLCKNCAIHLYVFDCSRRSLWRMNWH